jgi:hypothetical protein
MKTAAPTARTALARRLAVAGPSEIMPTVPAISRFFGIVIAMFFDDHDPPHFHARHTAGEARVRIDTLEVMDSSLGRRPGRRPPRSSARNAAHLGIS